MAAEITSAGARHVVLLDARRLAARADRLPPPRGRAVSFASPDRAAGACCSCPLAAVGLRAGSSAGACARPPRFVQPALLPNVVDRVPGWRRHLPGGAPPARRRGVPARLRAAARDALGALRGGDRRPRDRHVALDGRDRRPADAARRRPGLGAPVPRATCPSKYRVAVVAFSSRAQVVSPPTTEPRVRRRRRSARCASARARRSATRSRPRSRSRRGTPQGKKLPAGAEAAAGRRSSSSPTARRTAGASSWPTPIRQARDGEGARLHGAARHRRPASCRCRTSAATSSASRCRRTPPRSARVAAQTGGSFFAAPTAGRPRRRLRRSEVAPRQDAQGRGDHRRLRGRRRPAAARRRRALGAVVQEGPVIRAAAAVARAGGRARA